jgi:hypothetical protein
LQVSALQKRVNYTVLETVGRSVRANKGKPKRAASDIIQIDGVIIKEARKMHLIEILLICTLYSQ